MRGPNVDLLAMARRVWYPQCLPLAQSGHFGCAKLEMSFARVGRAGRASAKFPAVHLRFSLGGVSLMSLLDPKGRTGCSKSACFARRWLPWRRKWESLMASPFPLAPVPAGQPLRPSRHSPLPTTRLWMGPRSRSAYLKADCHKSSGRRAARQG